MNLILFSAADKLEGSRIRFTDARLRHLREVLDATEGETLRVGEIGGKMGSASVVSVAEHQAILEVNLDQAPPEKLPVVLVLALPRPKMLRRILRAVAELGVPELHLVNSYRVEKSYWQTPALEAKTVEAYFLQGLQQSRDTVLPRLFRHPRFKPFVEDELPGLVADRRALLAHPGDYPPCPVGSSDSALLVIGPEGGFVPYEVEKMRQAGCETVSFGPRILRVENAMTALLPRLGTAEPTQHSLQLGIDPLSRRSGLRGPAQTTAGAGRSRQPIAEKASSLFPMQKSALQRSDMRQ